jgi:hypothetical protein
MRIEDPVKARSYPGKRGSVERAARVARRVAGCEQPFVALPQRNVQVLGQRQQQLRAGSGLAEFHEAQVPR